MKKDFKKQLNKNMSKIETLAESTSVMEIENKFSIKYIDREDIIPNKRNKFVMVNIDELKENIEEVGLQHNLVVRDLGNGKYEIISGHRRFEALSRIEGNRYSKIPCIVKKVNEVDGELELIQSNSQTRELSEKEKLWFIGRMHDLYEIKKEKENLTGRVREIVAKAAGMSASQVGRYQRIYKKGTEELKEAVYKGIITIANANEIATLSQEKQNEFVDMFIEKSGINVDETKELVAKIKAIEEETNQALDQHTKEDDNGDGSLTPEQLEEIKNAEEEKTAQIKNEFTSDDEETLIIRKKFKSPAKSLRRTAKWIEKIDLSKPELRTELEVFVDELNEMTERFNELLKKQQ